MTRTCLSVNINIFLCLSQAGLRWWGFSMFNEVRWVMVIRLLKFQNVLMFKQTKNNKPLNPRISYKMKVFWILSLSKLCNKYLQHSSPFRIRCFKRFSVFLSLSNPRSSNNWSSVRTFFGKVCTSPITRSICSIICNFIYRKFSLTFFLHIPVT